MQLSFWRNDHPIIPTGQWICDFQRVWHIYSGSSPQFTMLSELYVPYRTHSLKLFPSNITSSLRAGWKWSLPLMPYGDAWREGRRMFTQYFHPGNAGVYRTTQVEFLYKMLPRLLKDPDNFSSITREYVSQLVINLSLKEYNCQCGWGDSHITCVWPRYQGDRWPICQASWESDAERWRYHRLRDISCWYIPHPAICSQLGSRSHVPEGSENIPRNSGRISPVALWGDN